MSSAGTSRARFPISLAVGRRIARRQRYRLGRYVAVRGHGAVRWRCCVGLCGGGAVRSGAVRCGPGGL